ncbi:MAG: hypothetical protein ACOCRX_09470 [Candidatus Woesearchaeota archaeon]
MVREEIKGVEYWGKYPSCFQINLKVDDFTYKENVDVDLVKNLNLQELYETIKERFENCKWAKGTKKELYEACRFMKKNGNN